MERQKKLVFCLLFGQFVLGSGVTQGVVSYYICPMESASRRLGAGQ